ncbi:hypothetical protein K435DRAFT_797587 [Dendrothele bispora CBS 962.96]|uniref:Uncharacterized protein n=1 Tax=Dendrothele bispora (strain CBS 962.96) TaxID=1314807 RepID=A0A4S8L2Z8_DENBC|nr:hypothetical protein K435DRAFT_932475 [Dendrothele bispora CBS 962.96]THU96168.1 hypothetical protein K435DRAFT_797587 [Dendrothele bispora CBS 962.96]
MGQSIIQMDGKVAPAFHLPGCIEADHKMYPSFCMNRQYQDREEHCADLWLGTPQRWIKIIRSHIVAGGLNVDNKTEGDVESQEAGDLRDNLSTPKSAGALREKEEEEEEEEKEEERNVDWYRAYPSNQYSL